MNRIFALLVVGGFFVPAAWALVPVRAGLAPYRAGELLVKYRGDAGSAAAVTLKGRLGLVSRATMLDGRLELLKLPSVMAVPAAAALLGGDPAVEYAEPNFLRYQRAVTPNDALFGELWGVLNTGQPNYVVGGPAGTPLGDLNLINAWDLDGDGVADHTGRGTVIVAVVDDAVETTHADLAANLVPGFNFVGNNNDPNPDPAADPAQSHGTSVAGCVAATGNNGIGVTGAAWNEKVMPLKFGFDVASEVQAFDYARSHGATIVNASFGGPSYTKSESDAISRLNDAGVLLVTAAGNENSNNDFSGANYPANYQFPNVVPVAATNRQDGIASFSTYGPVSIPLAAPGLQIVTTALNNGYTTNPGISGTSFSSPYAAGVAALIRDYFPAAGAAEVKARLIEGAAAGLDPTSPARQRTAGGRIDAASSLRLAARPAIVIQPVQTSSYDVDYCTAPQSCVQTIPVYSPVIVDDGGNHALDPGETTNLRITLSNLWQSATAVSATLSASGGVTVNDASTATEFGNLATGASAAGTFSVSVPANISGHRYVNFTLNISADAGAYSAQRQFTLEIGRLQDGVGVTQAIQTDLYDEFHTWHFDVGTLPAGSNTLSFTTTASNDIDIAVRYGEPAQYEVSLGADRSDTDAFSFYNVPDAQIGGSAGGNETVTIANPQSGTYYVTVVNYDQTQNAAYTLRAALTNTAPAPAPAPAPANSGGGGGAMPPLGIVAGWLLIGWRRRGVLRIRTPAMRGKRA